MGERWPIDCDFCGSTGWVSYEDPTLRVAASMRCPVCTPEDEDLDPRVDADA